MHEEFRKVRLGFNGAEGVSFGPYVFSQGVTEYEPNVTVHDLGPLPTPESEEECAWDVFADANMGAYTVGGADNPHPPRSLLHMVYALGLAAGHQSGEWEHSDAGQAAQVVEEQPRWEHAERLGANDAARYVKSATDSLLGFLALRHCPSVLLREARVRLVQRVWELLRLANDGEGHLVALEPSLDMQDAEAEDARLHALTFPEGSEERQRWMRMAWRLSFAPDVDALAGARPERPFA